MTTLARRHFQHVSAIAASAATDAGAPINASGYELALSQLAEDRRRLKSMQSIERRIDAKRLMLPAYAPWVQGALEAGRGGQDAVLMTIMVWKIDVDDFDGALDIADYALRYDLVLPDQFQRTVATLVTEEIADKALQWLASDQAAPWPALSRLHELTRDHDMPDEVRAKLLKACGLEFSRLASVAGSDVHAAVDRARSALEFLRRALALHDKVGVKKDIERVERFLKHHPPSTRNAAESRAPADQDASADQAGARTPATRASPSRPGATAAGRDR